jgi:hypothetical protein
MGLPTTNDLTGRLSLPNQNMISSEKATEKLACVWLNEDHF